MTEKAFRYILTKHYPNIKFHGETLPGMTSVKPYWLLQPVDKKG